MSLKGECLDFVNEAAILAKRECVSLEQVEYLKISTTSFVLHSQARCKNNTTLCIHCPLYIIQSQEIQEIRSDYSPNA